MRLIEMFHEAASKWPERICLVDETGERSYSQVQRAAWSIANGLRAQGIAPGTRIGMYGANSADHMEGIFGILSAECVWVPLNARNTPAEVASYLRRLDVDVILYTSSVDEAMRELRGLLPDLRLTLNVDSGNGDSGRVTWAGEPLPAAGSLSPLRGDELVSIMSSGGTTGDPKGIALTEINWSFGAATLAIHYPGESPVYLVSAPLSHAAGGLGLMMLGRGPKYVVLPGFEPETVMEAVQKHRVTHLFLPPTAIYMMLAHPRRDEFDYSSIEYFMYAGAPMSTTKLREAVEVFGPVMTQFYAQMECFASITNLSKADHVEALADPAKAGRLASAGRATTFVRVEFMDGDGNLLPDGERGELVVRSHLKFSHYLGAFEPEPQDGWHHTGDVGYRDADGFIYIVDRVRDLVISGGFNVYPTEVEQVVLAHPAVRDCAVIGVPDEKWGEAVTAVVELKDGHALTSDELIAFCRRTLSGVKTPKNVVVVEALPRSPVGKVLRRAVREPYWKHRERAI